MHLEHWMVPLRIHVIMTEKEKAPGDRGFFGYSGIRMPKLVRDISFAVIGKKPEGAWLR